MLYERWLSVARAHRNEVALREVSSGARWTFGELREKSDGPFHSSERLIHPRGMHGDFIFAVLRGWRLNQVICPLEPGQAPTVPSGLPAGIVHVKTTSATAGAPRWVALTADQMAADAANIVETMGLRPDWPNVGAISLAHSYGFSNLVTPLLLHGIPLILVDSPLPERILAASGLAPRVTLPAVPALWRAWHEAGAIPAQVRLAISAGAPLPLALEESVFQSTGLKLHNFYGATECGGIAYDRSDRPRADSACAGAPLEHVGLAAAEDGCLEVRSAAVAERYWPEPSVSLEAGCYRTNDLVELREGLVFLRGRTGDQINVAGRKVSPESIEQMLQKHPAVRECLVFGAPSTHAGRGEKIVACLAVRSRVSVEQLQTFLLDHLPSWQVPRDWWFVDSLGTNQRGKVSRSAWRRQYLERA